MSVPTTNTAAGPPAKWSPAPYVAHAGSGAGALWLQGWRDYITRKPEVSPSAARDIILDEFKTKFKNDYANCPDKPKLAKYFLNFVKNYKKNPRRVSQNEPTPAPADSPTHNAPPTGSLPMVGALNSPSTPVPLVRLRNNASPTLVNVPVQLQSTVQTLNLDIKAVLPLKPKAKMSIRSAVSRVFPLELDAIKDKIQSELSEPLPERDNSVHRKAVTEFLEIATDAQWVKLHAFVTADEESKDADANPLATLESFRRAGPLICDHMRKATGLAFIMVGMGRQEGTEDYLCVITQDTKYRLGDNEVVTRALQQRAYDLVISAQEHPFAHDQPTAEQSRGSSSEPSENADEESRQVNDQRASPASAPQLAFEDDDSRNDSPVPRTRKVPVTAVPADSEESDSSSNTESDEDSQSNANSDSDSDESSDSGSDEEHTAARRTLFPLAKSIRSHSTASLAPQYLEAQNSDDEVDLSSGAPVPPRDLRESSTTSLNRRHDSSSSSSSSSSSDENENENEDDTRIPTTHIRLEHRNQQSSRSAAGGIVLYAGSDSEAESTIAPTERNPAASPLAGDLEHRAANRKASERADDVSRAGDAREDVPVAEIDQNDARDDFPAIGRASPLEAMDQDDAPVIVPSVEQPVPDSMGQDDAQEPQQESRPAEESTNNLAAHLQVREPLAVFLAHFDDVSDEHREITKMDFCLRKFCHKDKHSTFVTLLEASTSTDWVNLVCAWARVECRFSSLVQPVVNVSLAVEQRPRALGEWVLARYAPARGPDELDNLHSEYVKWYLSMQPAGRRPTSFAKMLAANAAPPAAYAKMMSTTKRGMMLLVHALAWMFRPGFVFETTGPARFASHECLIRDLAAVFGQMGRLPVARADAAGLHAESPIPPRVAGFKRASVGPLVPSPSKRVKHCHVQKPRRARKSHS